MLLSLGWDGVDYWYCRAVLAEEVLTTRNRMRLAIESGKGMKVKVVKWC